MEKKKILIVDDDSEIREALKLLLNCEGYEIVEAFCGKDALDKMEETIDLVILDVMMPEMDGYTVCEELRKTSTVPILLLTAKAQDSDKIIGFSAGADDYLVKPFSYGELISRVKALLRRYCVYGAHPLMNDGIIRCCNTVEIDTTQGIVRQDGKEVFLTDTEYRILVLLATHKKKIFSIQNIYESIWQEPYFYNCNNTVTVHIRNIRRKLGDDPQNNHTIKNIWGKGYRIE